MPVIEPGREVFVDRATIMILSPADRMADAAVKSSWHGQQSFPGAMSYQGYVTIQEDGVDRTVSIDRVTVVSLPAQAKPAQPHAKEATVTTLETMSPQRKPWNAWKPPLNLLNPSLHPNEPSMPWTASSWTKREISLLDTTSICTAISHAATSSSH